MSMVHNVALYHSSGAQHRSHTPTRYKFRVAATDRQTIALILPDTLDGVRKHIKQQDIIREVEKHENKHILHHLISQQIFPQPASQFGDKKTYIMANASPACYFLILKI